MFASSDPIAVFAAVFAALYTAHVVGDHWIQTEHQAARKGEPGWPGRVACATHVATYTATAAVALLLVVMATGVGLSPAGVTAGLAISAATHYAADRRTPLRLLATSLGLAEFHKFGAPRPGRDDNPTLGTGAYALDQSYHVAFLFVASLVIAGWPA